MDAQAAKRRLQALEGDAAPLHDWVRFRDELIDWILQKQGTLVGLQRKLLRATSPELVRDIAQRQAEIDQLRSIKLEVDAKIIELQVT